MVCPSNGSRVIPNVRTLMLGLFCTVVVAASDLPASLSPTDRLLVREAQLSLAQAHITLLQDQLRVKESEAALSALIQSLKTQYACPDCELQSDLTWRKRTPAPKPETAAPQATPAPPKASGQTSKKE